jgi:hypothetical protein
VPDQDKALKKDLESGTSMMMTGIVLTLSASRAAGASIMTTAAGRTAPDMRHEI